MKIRDDIIDDEYNGLIYHGESHEIACHRLKLDPQRYKAATARRDFRKRANA